MPVTDRDAADVLVVGGGPAGAATATWVARLGHDVLLLDKRSFPREKPCAEYFSPGVIAALDRLGVLDAVRGAAPAWPRGMRIIGARHSFLLTYEDAPGAGPATGMGLSRAILDQLLLEHARSAGVRVRERSQVIDTLREFGRVVGVRCLGPAGPETLRARLVIAADGLRSTVAHSLGLDRPTRWPRRLGLVARYADAAIGDSRHSGDSGDVGEMHVGHGLYCGLGAVGGGLVSVGLVGSLDAKRPSESVEHYFERRLAELPGAARALAGARRVTPVRGVGPIARRVRRTAGPGFLLVGDAAGFTDPFTGEGVFRALRGAELAADAAARLLAGDDGASYGQARRATFAARERVTALIQGLLTVPPLFDAMLAHLARRPAAADRLRTVLGDYAPAAPLLTPAYAWSLLGPGQQRAMSEG